MYYAYIYSDPVTRVPFYVGKGSGRRAYVHTSRCHNKRMKAKIEAIKLAGAKPIVNLIETSTNEFALMLEKGLVKLFGRKDIGTGSLYNLNDGGNFTGAKKGRPAPNKGTKLSEERKLQMSIRMKGINAGVPVTKASCVFCKKSGGLPAMSRYHFKNCKEAV